MQHPIARVPPARRRFRGVAAGLAMWFAFALPAGAATPLMIWPVDPVIGSGERAAALWLENHGEQPVAMQVRVFSWRQEGGQDIYDTQQQVVASPPIASIPAGRRQLVRLMALAPLPPGQEHAFRVMIDELPTAAKFPGTGPDTPPAAGVAVQVQIRYSVPLFVYGEGAGDRRKPPPQVPASGLLEPRLHWHLALAKGADRKPGLCIANAGGARARLTAVAWRGVRGDTPINAGLLGYVLPGSQQCWPLEGPAPPGAELKATINGSPASVEHAAD
jgi:fimbrial chaperone protein